MSLGSKELFHSNFIAWFADTFPTLAADAFAGWGQPAQSQAMPTDREVAHLDLVLYLPGLAPIAIENKVLSVPDESQLDHYADRLASARITSDDPSRILLSFMSPGWQEGTYHGWVLHTYGELAAVLRSQVGTMRVEDHPFEADLLEHYIRLITLLDELIDLLGTPTADQPFRLHPVVLSELERSRGVAAGIQKARASYLARVLRLQIQNRWADIEVDHDFTRGTGLVQAFRRLPSEDGEEPDWIGWQVQGSQFRLAVLTGPLALHGEAKRGAREDYVMKKYESWFDFGPLESVSGPASAARATEVRGGNWAFQAFLPNFVHRYRLAPDLTVDQLVALGLTYMERAEQL